MAFQTGSGMKKRPTKKRRGGFLGTLLASVAAPMVLNKLLGGDMGLRNRIRRGRGLRNRTLHEDRFIPYIPPSQLGRGGRRKRRRQRLGRKSPFNSISLLGNIF